MSAGDEWSQLADRLVAARPDIDCFCGSIEQLREAVIEAERENREAER